MSESPLVPSSSRMRLKLGKPSGDPKVLVQFLSGYSRRVKVLRTVLPLAGFVLLGVIIAWPFGKQLYEKQFEDTSLPTTKLILENRFINPQLVDMDEKNHPFSLAAKSSVQRQESQAELEKPRGRMKTDDDTEVMITADKGDYNKDAGILTYIDNVVLTTGDGYEFKTRQAQLHTKTHIADGHDPVIGHGPAGEVEAEKGFKIDHNQKTLRFYGQTRLMLLDKKKPTP